MTRGTEYQPLLSGNKNLTPFGAATTEFWSDKEDMTIAQRR